MLDEARETDLNVEYALNAVNQGVTSLGIKGVIRMLQVENTDLLIGSYEWNCSCHGKEIVLSPHRSAVAL